jgi:hypothetical protein
MLEQAAGGDRLGGVDRILAYVDVLYDTLLVDDERRSLRQFVARGPDLLHAERHPKLFEHLSVRIAQQRKMNVDLLRVCGVRRWTVTAHPKDHRLACFQLGPISLIGFQFAGSSIREGQHVENDDHVLLPAEIAEFHFLPVVAEESEVWCFVSWSENTARRSLGMGQGGEGKGC